MKKIDSEELIGRINEIRVLTDDAIKEGENEEPIKPESTDGIIAFLDKFDFLGMPVIGAFPEGTYSAGWKIEQDKHLLIEFVDKEEVCFSIIMPDDVRMNGRCAKHEQAIKILTALKVTGWQHSLYSFEIKMIEDKEVGYISESNVKGLHVEAKNQKEFIEILNQVLPDLVSENYSDKANPNLFYYTVIFPPVKEGLNPLAKEYRYVSLVH